MKIAVIGAGNTGQIMAFDLAQKGADVRLYDRSPEKAEYLARHGLTAQGRLEGHVALGLVTADIQKAVHGAELVCVMTTAQGHRPIAQALKPHLADGQILIVFNANWGALEFHRILGAGGGASALIGETGTQLYIGNSPEPGLVVVKEVKREIPLGMVEKECCDQVIARLKTFFPQCVKAESVLETSLSNPNPIVHAPVVLFNLSRIEMGDEFLFYPQGASRSTMAYVEHVDSERLAIAQALGVRSSTMLEIINSFWPAKKATLYDAVLENPSYQAAKGPQTLSHRYLSEDLPYGIVPLVHLGRGLGVATPYMDAMIAVFERYLGRDLMASGFCPDVQELVRFST